MIFSGGKRKCKNPKCGKEFIPLKDNHLYCCRFCFFEEYKRKQKVQRFPSFICPVCNTVSTLDFHPKRSRLQWFEYECPRCGYQVKEENDYLLIRKIRIELHREFR